MRTTLLSAPTGNADMTAIASAREVWGPHEVGGAELGGAPSK
jgi:hypothetical protein